MLEELLEEFLRKYDNVWFENGWQLFKHHPSNEERKDSFEGVQYNYGEDNFIEAVQIDLYKFLYGTRDDSYDDIHDEIQSEKLEIVDYEGRLVPTLKEGLEYSSSNNLYPKYVLRDWEREFFNELRLCTDLLCTLSEKNNFYSAVLELLAGYKEINNKIKDGKILYHHVIDSFFSQIISDIKKQSVRIERLQGIVGDHLKGLHFKGTQADLARVIAPLIKNGRFLETDVTVCNFFMAHVTVEAAGKAVVPITLYDVVRKEKNNRR